MHPYPMRFSRTIWWGQTSINVLILLLYVIIRTLGAWKTHFHREYSRASKLEIFEPAINLTLI